MTRLYHGLTLNDEADVNFHAFAHDMLRSYYAVSPEETTQEMFARAAINWSTFKGKTDMALAQRMLDRQSERWFMWASPAQSNAPDLGSGTIRGMPISCFLGYVPDNLEGLIDHTAEMRWLSVFGGGCGAHWSDVRSPSDKAPGAMPFISTFDRDMLAYRQGKTRKGSYAAFMDVTHPEIEEFIRMRVPSGDVNRKNLGLHHGVNLTDAFMEAVLLDGEYELVDPKTGPTGKLLRARYMWELILETRFRTGEPFLVFIDTANRKLNPALAAKGLRINGSNLCTEIFLPTSKDRTAVCCLSSPNAEFYDEWKDTSLIRDLVRCLDNILEFFIENAPPQLAKAVRSAAAERSIGIGLMGVHTYLQKRGIPYDSEEGVRVAGEISRHIREEFKKETRQLAIERGEPEDLVGTGTRNAHGQAIAPNASSGVVLMTSPSGEAISANAYTQRTRAGSVLVRNRILEALLEEKGQNTEETWLQILRDEGSVQELDCLSATEKAVFKTASEMDQHWVVWHASERQPYIDQGQSVNLRFPAGSERAYVQNVHLMAWTMGLKSLYYLRTDAKVQAENVGSEQEVPLLVATDAVEEEPTGSTGLVVYGAPGCSQCEQAKRLLQAMGVPFEYVDIRTTNKTAAEISGVPGHRALPTILQSGRFLGGLPELRKFLLDATKAPTQASAGVSCINCEG
jgi:ribonucleoside-diphosphate reductase alpha chain